MLMSLLMRLSDGFHGCAVDTQILLDVIQRKKSSAGG